MREVGQPKLALSDRALLVIGCAVLAKVPMFDDVAFYDCFGPTGRRTLRTLLAREYISEPPQEKHATWKLTDAGRERLKCIMYLVSPVLPKPRRRKRA